MTQKNDTPVETTPKDAIAQVPEAPMEVGVPEPAAVEIPIPGPTLHQGEVLLSLVARPKFVVPWRK